MSVGANKAYDTKGFVKACRDLNVTPHVAQNTKRTGGSAIDARTTRHRSYELSQRARKQIEQCFGWGKTVGALRQAMVHDFRTGEFRRGKDPVPSRRCRARRPRRMTRRRSRQVRRASR